MSTCPHHAHSLVGSSLGSLGLVSLTGTLPNRKQSLQAVLLRLPERMSGSEAGWVYREGLCVSCPCEGFLAGLTVSPVLDPFFPSAPACLGTGER